MLQKDEEFMVEVDSFLRGDNVPIPGSPLRAGIGNIS